MIFYCCHFHLVFLGADNKEDPSDKKQIIKYGNILLGVHFNLRYSKLKSDYSKVIKSAYVMGVVQNHFYHSVKEITT